MEIADHGLYCNSATSIVLHEGLKRIGAFAFSETEAGEIIVPATVEWIGYGAFMWEGLEPVIQNPDCVWETEAQYNSRIWAEASANDEVVWSYDGWPLRTDEIIRDEDGRDFLRITMKDDSGLMYVSTRRASWPVVLMSITFAAILSFISGIPRWSAGRMRHRKTLTRRRGTS